MGKLGRWDNSSGPCTRIDMPAGVVPGQTFCRMVPPSPAEGAAADNNSTASSGEDERWGVGRGGGCSETRRPVEAQQFSTTPVRLASASASASDGGGDGSAGDEYAYLYFGERWQTGPDGVHAHGFQHWEPLRFDEEGRVLPLRNATHFELRLPPVPGGV